MPLFSWLPPPDGSRDRRIDDRTNVWVIHPAGRALLPLSLRLAVPANLVSLLGLMLGAGAALCLSRWSDWHYACLAFLLCIFWLIADGLDGMIARTTGTASDLGRFLDGICDHVVFLLLYVSLAASIGTFEGWALALAAGAAHAVQATIHEGERIRYHRRVRGDAGTQAGPPSPNLLVRCYDAVANSLDRFAAPFDDLMRRSADPQGLAALYGSRAAPPLKMMSLLSNNMRVVAIWLACLAGNPRLFWWLELGPLSLLCLAGIMWHRSVERAFVGPDAPPQTTTKGSI